MFFIEEPIAVDDVEVSRTKRGFGKSGPPCNSKYLKGYYLKFQTRHPESKFYEIRVNWNKTDYKIYTTTWEISAIWLA